MNFNENDAGATKSPGSGATLVGKPTVILAENAGSTTPDTQEEDPAPGRKTSVLENHGYTLGRTIGSGSYATVKVARSKLHGCDVAVKIVSKFQAPADYLRKFLPREIEVVKGLKHQNLIRFLQAIETTHRVYIVMELAENGSLLDIIRRDTYIDEVRARRWFQQLVDGVDYCHEKGVVHRDIKCDNLLMDIDDNIKLSDFGFARGHMKPRNGVFPLSDTFCGSYAYASPEILRQVPYEPQLSDIWSMGVVLYAIVFGRLPFDDTNYNHLLKQVQAKVIFPKEPRVSSACKALIRRILAPARSRLKMTAIRNDVWFTLSSDVTRSLSSEDSLDSVATSSRNDSLEQTSVIQPLLTKEVLKAAASKPRPDGGNTTDEEQPIQSVLVLAALVAVASAGGPAAYSTYTAPASYGSVGATHESTIKGYGGNSVISQYSKAVDSAYSSVRKYDTRISNDAQALAYAPAYAPASYAAPAIASYGGYAAPALAARAYAAPAISAYGGYAAPALAARAYAAPAISAYGGYAAPALAARAYGAPALASYGGYAAPALAARAYGAPAVASYGGYAAPALAAHAYAAPGLSAYGAPAGIVSHVSFAGLGANYGW